MFGSFIIIVIIIIIIIVIIVIIIIVIIIVNIIIMIIIIIIITISIIGIIRIISIIILVGLELQEAACHFKTTAISMVLVPCSVFQNPVALGSTGDLKLCGSCIPKRLELGSVKELNFCCDKVGRRCGMQYVLT